MYSSYKKRKTKISTIIIIAIILIFLISMIYKIYGEIQINNYNNKDAQKLQTVQEVKDKNNTVTEMLNNVMPTIVGISKMKDNGSSIFSTEGAKNLAIGSGVIISEKGYILTNQHVSGEKYSTCYVTLETGDVQTGTVVWSDSELDLAILKININTVNHATLGDSNNINIGETVYAIGNPIGYEFQRTVTSGIISAVNRTITFNENNSTTYMDNLIQTDATINPGNSGGPLLNIDGEIIGINTIKITTAEGIGFAVPINVIKPIIKELEEKGEFREASIGIFAYDKNVIPYLNSGIKFDKGIYVADIAIDSTTKNTELRQGDIIIKIDEIELEKMSELREYIYTKNPGDEVVLTVLRNNRNHEIRIKLKAK